MSSKISTWLQWYVGTEGGTRHFTLNSATVADITTLKISQYDWIEGTDPRYSLQTEFLKSLNVDSEITLKGVMTAGTGVGNTASLTLRVSGEPSYIPRSSGIYSFPVEPVSSTYAIWDTGLNGRVDLYGPTYGGSLSFNLDSDNVTISEESTLSGVTSRNERWNTREGDIRKKMYRMTQAENNISFIYKELLRSMIASFSELGYISSEEKFIKTKCVHANAERTIAKLKQDNNIILPIVSISQTVSNNNKNRRRAENVLVQEKWWDEEKQRAFRVLSFAPRAVDIMYQLNIWTKYMSDMDQILEQVRLKFNPEMEVPTKYSTLTKAYIDTEEDSGKLTAGDKEDRIIQKTINIVVEAYIPNPKFLVTSSGKIEKFVIGC